MVTTDIMSEESRKILLAVCGGIAAYKAADLCSKLAQSHAQVRVVFSKSAHQFIAPVVFEALSGHPVYRSVFDTETSYQMEHISWARWADTLVIAPASADALARMAAGIADDALTTLYLAFDKSVYIAPSMNSTMLQHPATQANIAVLKERGCHFIEPGSGSLACGETGSGRMAEPARILTAIGVSSFAGEAGDAPNLKRTPDDSLRGVDVLITSGPTREYLDQVRFISSPSSGKMGYSLALEALRRGAKVHYVTGPVDTHYIPGEKNCIVHHVTSAQEMLLKVQDLKQDCDLFIFAAAVGDFRPAQTINHKMKRTGNSITLPLVENPDVAQAVGFSKQPHQVTIGFAAETNDHTTNGQAKLAKKHLDAIVINDVGNKAIGFNSDENEIQILTTDNDSLHISQRSKEDVAFEILDVGARLLAARPA